MPNNTNNYSIDYYLYKYLPLFIPNINPNIVTTVNLVLIIPMVYFLYHNIYFDIYIVMSFIRSTLDIMDGAIARHFNRCSAFGKYYDFIVDFIFWQSLLLTKYSVTGYMPIISLNLYGFYLLYWFLLYGDDLFSDNIVFKVIHDNTLLFVPLYCYLIYYI